VELLGNHTDYNEGFVLGAAINRGISVSGDSRPDNKIVLKSKAKGRVEVDAHDLSPVLGSWTNYTLGVVTELRASGIPLDGFSAEIKGDLPAGWGLSSSAALEVASALFLLKLGQRTLPPLEIAKICQRAEHHFVGVKSGLLDQVTSLFGRANHVVFFDTRTEEIRTIPFPENLALIVAESGKARELAEGSYNRRRSETLEAAARLGVAALRDAHMEQLHCLPDLLRRRASHIVGENTRVLRALELLSEKDGAGFGALLNESHESSRQNFENSSAELDTLVSVAQRIPGVLGARLTGAGFGGATITLCEATRAQAIASEICDRYAGLAGFQPQVLVAQFADGAQ
jgi:galactokinase